MALYDVNLRFRCPRIRRWGHRLIESPGAAGPSSCRRWNSDATGIASLSIELEVTDAAPGAPIRDRMMGLISIETTFVGDKVLQAEISRYSVPPSFRMQPFTNATGIGSGDQIFFHK